MGDRNVLGFLKDWALNLADPDRQEFRRHQQLIQQRELLRAQSAETRGAAINEAAIKTAQIKADQDRQEMLTGLFADRGLPTSARAAAGGQVFPFLKGLDDPGFFFPPLTELEKSTVGLEGARGQEATGAGLLSTARAGQINNLERALGDPDRLAEFLGRTGALSFVTPETSISGLPAQRVLGAAAPEARPPNIVDVLAEGRLTAQALAGSTKTFEGDFGESLTTITEGIDSPELQAALGVLQGLANVPQDSEESTLKRRLNNLTDEDRAVLLNFLREDF